MRKIILFCLTIFLLISCQYFQLIDKKEWDKKNDNKDASVYIAGLYDDDGALSIYKNTACYWKDNEFVSLESPSGGGAYDIFFDADNNDIYVAGFVNGEENTGTTIACYWKNGTLQTLSPNSQGSVANSIYKIGNDIFIGGYYRTTDGYIRACYWENGKFFEVDTTDSKSFDIYVDRSEFEKVILVGYFRPAADNLACYWLNGARFHLSELASNASSLYYENNILFVGGYVTNPRDACYWNNKKLYDISSQDSSIKRSESNSILQYDGKIYNAGYLITQPAGSPDIYYACYWENGNLNLLSGGVKANSIKISNNDIFISGIYNDISEPRACYWKNGNKIDLLPDKYSIAYKLRVIKKL